MSETSSPTPSLPRGIAAIKRHLRTLPNTPGVYRMLDRAGEVLYVGKARSLKRRVSNYTQPIRLPIRLQRMVAQTDSMEFVTTHTEVEALLLESNLIKRLRPRYNVLLRDDKSFPYIHLTGETAWPQVKKYRGPRNLPGEFFGPFASAGAVNRTLSALERAFLLRTCSDSMFHGRTRPCLKYQLKRCCAPCVDYIDPPAYAELVEQAARFLAGDDKGIQKSLAASMRQASANLDFELAARYRDRIRAITQVQAHQGINLETARLVEADIIAAHQDAGQISIQVFFFRGGRNNGNRAYFPRHDKSDDADTVLAAFVGQFYDTKTPPREVIVSHRLPEQTLLAEALSVRAERTVKIVNPQRGAKRVVLNHALQNAREALGRRIADHSSQERLLTGIARLFGLDQLPQRIEVYDNSHVSGAHPVGAMIVSGPDGFQKNAYRRFNIKTDIAPGDDYAMMREVLSRRFARATREDPDRSRNLWPDLVLIDGGAGQLSTALAVLDELGIHDQPIAGIAKGPDRDAGRERIFIPNRKPFRLDQNDPLLYYLQRLRDEAHRFAIGSHRAKRSRAITKSPLDEISGIGARRKRALLEHFGSARGVARAGLSDLETVGGISRTVAQKVYDFFHGDS